jgi:hypothetical protein
MIIKATRIATTSGAGAVASHVLRGEKNEEIRLLQGSEAEMHAAMKDAEAAGAKYGLRHYKISPKEGMTSDDAREILRDLGREFRFDPDRATLIEHQKPRAGDQGFDRHWHAIVPEVDPISGRVLDAHWMRPRHEKVARMAEARLGHEVVVGRFNAAVQRALADEGRHDVAARIQPATEVARPREGYATNIHQMHNRKGHDLPNDRLLIREAWERSDNGQAFQAALAERGIDVRPGEKEGVFVAYRGQDFLGAIHRLVGVPKHEAAQRLEAAPAPQPEPPAPETPTPQSEPPQPGSGQPAPEIRSDTNFQATDAAPAATATLAQAPQGGGGGGGGSSPAPAADEAPKPSGGSSDLFSSEDPTAGIERPKPGDLAGEIRYREKVMKRAAEIAERKARQRTPAPQQQQGGKNARTQTSGGRSGENDKAAAAAAAAAHEALLELIERGRKVREQAEFDKLLEAYISAARIRHEARRGDASASRSRERPASETSGVRDRHSRRDEPAARRREPDAVAGNSEYAGLNHGGTDEDRERAARTAAALERRFEATRLERAFEGVDLTAARTAHEAMKNGPRTDPLEGLSRDEAKAKKDEFRAQLWEQFRADGRVLREFDLMDRREARQAEIEAAAPIRERMKERWPRLNQAQMKRAREVINATIKQAGDEVREQQKQRPKRDFKDYVKGLAECFNDERAQFILAYEERRKAQKTALFQPVNDALQAIADERAKAPKPRDPEAEGKAARRALWAPYEAAQERLREAREAFEAMEKPKGWRWLNRAAYDAYDAARDRMNVAQAEVNETKPSPTKLDNAEAKAQLSAQVGHGEYQRWQNVRGRHLDQREAALTNIKTAMEGGDKQMIRTMRNGGIDAALELQRKRDEEERKAREAALKAANVVQMRQQNRQGIEMPAPRMR